MNKSIKFFKKKKKKKKKKSAPKFKLVYYIILYNIIFSAVKRLIPINLIQNKSFYLHNISVCTVYIYYVYNTYNFFFFENIYMYLFIVI